MFDFFYSVVQNVDSLAWGALMIVILFGTHIFCTIRTGFVQRKVLSKGIKLSFAKDEGAEGDVSHFDALAMHLAAIVGMGNIIGVGTAVALGGPGAVLWCWLTGVFGIATKYAESLIAIKYRVKDEDGRVQGGAMYALERGLNMKFLAVLFALFAAFASFGIGCASQVQSIASVCDEYFSAPPWLVGLLCAGLTAAVIFGGIKRIARVCEKVIPAMTVFYVLGCIIILVMNGSYIVPAIREIARLAFRPGAAAGGSTGGGLRLAMQYGVARGLFSNESGLGSAPIIASPARTKNPVRQALVSASATFWDTVVICLMSGLVIVSTMLKFPHLNLGEIRDGNVLTTLVFSQFPIIGPVVLVGGVITFAYTTFLGWVYYGERCVEYLLGKMGVIPYRVIYVALAFTAPLLSLDFLTLLADALNALMALPNIVAILLLSPVIASETKKYINNLDAEDSTPIPTVRVGVLKRREARAKG